MRQENLEMYIGVIYRMRESPTTPLPLKALQDYFGFSPISIHEMITKLKKQNYVSYIPYQGVTLTERGEESAAAMIRRHRIWEQFLYDMLGFPTSQIHDIACSLEHAAPDSVTEKLIAFMGNPTQCPHGETIPSSTSQKGATMHG